MCVYTYLTAQGYALLTLSGISPMTPRQEGKAGVLLRNGEVSWRSVCVLQNDERMEVATGVKLTLSLTLFFLLLFKYIFQLC